MTERAVPFYCPYCGEEDLVPVEEPQGAWRCGDCRRAFTVRLARLAPTTTSTDTGEVNSPA